MIVKAPFGKDDQFERQFSYDIVPNRKLELCAAGRSHEHFVPYVRDSQYGYFSSQHRLQSIDKNRHLRQRKAGDIDSA